MSAFDDKHQKAPGINPFAGAQASATGQPAAARVGPRPPVLGPGLGTAAAVADAGPQPDDYNPATLIHRGTSWLRHAVDHGQRAAEAEPGLLGGLANATAGVPLLGTATRALASVGSGVEQLQDGVVSSVVNAATGVADLGADVVFNPLGTAGRLAGGVGNMIEHSGIPMLSTGARFGHDLFNTATGDQTLAGSVRRLDPTNLETQREDQQYWRELVMGKADEHGQEQGGLVGDYRQDWREGRYMHMAGRIAGDALPFLLGGGGAAARGGAEAAAVGGAERAAVVGAEDAAALGERATLPAPTPASAAAEAAEATRAVPAPNRRLQMPAIEPHQIGGPEPAGWQNLEPIDRAAVASPASAAPASSALPLGVESTHPAAIAEREAAANAAEHNARYANHVPTEGVMHPYAEESLAHEHMILRPIWERYAQAAGMSVEEYAMACRRAEYLKIPPPPPLAQVASGEAAAAARAPLPAVEGPGGMSTMPATGPAPARAPLPPAHGVGGLSTMPATTPAPPALDATDPALHRRP